MKAKLLKAWGYQGDPMSLPVADVEAAVPFYETILGFLVTKRGTDPHRNATLERDGLKIRLIENGGDPSQDGCAFEVADAEAAFVEFKENGLEKEISDFDIEENHGARWKVFYVVAPDGLCYWFGQKLAETS